MFVTMRKINSWLRKSKNFDHFCDCRRKFVILNMNVTKEKTRVDVQLLHFSVIALEISQNVIGKKSSFKIISTGIPTRVRMTNFLGEINGSDQGQLQNIIIIA